MKLYHGTSAAVARAALKEGLKPRSVTGKNNWKHTCESNAECVYLTDIYAPYFAMNAVGDDDKAGVVEVETDLLNGKKLMPDEDWLEQATREHPVYGVEAGNWGKTMEERTKRCRLLMTGNRHLWKNSVEGLGTCAHHGVIQRRAITRVAILDASKNRKLALAVIQPTICILNHRFCAENYRLLTRRFMGERVTVQEMALVFHHHDITEHTLAKAREIHAEHMKLMGNVKQAEKIWNQWAVEVGNHAGITVIENK